MKAARLYIDIDQQKIRYIRHLQVTTQLYTVSRKSEPYMLYNNKIVKPQLA